jgi:hypothetical protein
MNRRPARARAPYAKSIVLLIALVLAFYIYNKVSKEGIAGRIVEMFGQPEVNLAEIKQFDDSQKKQILHGAAGFWTYRSERGGSDMPMGLDDRIELKDNGIVWRVRTETLFLPSGDSTIFVHISHAFLNPFGRANEEDGLALSEVHFIGLIWIHGADTCYVPTHKKVANFDDQVWTRSAIGSWLHRMDNGALELDGHKYSRYPDSARVRFFPGGAIDLIDSINIRECPPGMTLSGLIREALVRDLETVTVAQRTADDVQKLTERYYVDFCLKPLVISRTGGISRKKGRVDMAFDVNWDGTVKDVKISSAQLMFHETVRKELADEVARWRFPKLEAQARPFRFSCSLTL